MECSMAVKCWLRPNGSHAGTGTGTLAQVVRYLRVPLTRRQRAGVLAVVCHVYLSNLQRLVPKYSCSALASAFMLTEKMSLASAR